MQAYLSNLLPRLRRHSKSLDHQELLIDQPWVLLDDSLNKHQYIFERGGKLIMSINGQVQYGKWRYIPAAKSLLIDRPGDSILLNQDYFTEGLCVLKRDGFTEEPWVLVNQRVVPDLNLKRYLMNLVPQTKGLKYVSTTAEGEIFFRESQAFAPGAPLYKESGEPFLGSISGSLGNFVFEAKDGKVRRVFRRYLIQTDKGDLSVEIQKGNQVPVTGDRVYLGQGFAPDGTYHLLDRSSVKKIVVKGGAVSKATYPLSDAQKTSIALAILIAIAIIVINLDQL